MLVSEVDGTWGPGLDAPALPANPNIGVIDTTLAKISCSTQVCAAVGTSDVSLSAGGHPAASTEGYVIVGFGDSWASLLAPLPPDASLRPAAELTDVSCAGSTCEAVGDYVDNAGNTRGLILDYAGTTWTPSEAPLPAGAATSSQSATVQAIACPATDSCSAAGNYTDAAGTQKPLLLSETSGTWSATKGILPAGTPTNPHPQFKAIDCSTPGDCAAVGFDDADKHHNQVLPLAVAKTGGTWHAGVNPDLPADAIALSTNAQQSSLLSVSCPTSAQCDAGGFYTATNESNPALIVTFAAGSGWSDGMEAPLPTDANPGEDQAARVFGISCGSGSTCEGVGWYKGPFGQFDRALILGGGTPSVGVAQAKRAQITGHTARVSISCRGRSGCSVAVTLANGSTGKVILGNSTAAVPAKHSKTVRIKLNAEGKKLLAGKKSLGILLSVSERTLLVSAQRVKFHR